MAHWFSEARFGMFIHWGLYAIPGGVWQGMDVPWVSEWIMRKYKIPIREYEKLAGEFNPVAFDAERWARSIRDAGMKYVVFTSKHHDGFAMFHSVCDKFNVYDATPFHRDVLQELSEACRKSGIRLGLYYSQDQDWHEPGASGNTWDFPEAEKTPDTFDAYLQKKVKPQLHELLTRYGDIGIVWFDTPVQITKEQSFMLKDYVHSIQKDCLVSGRVGNDAGDYVSLGDNQLPVYPYRELCEGIGTMNESWGYKRMDNHYYSTRELLRILCCMATNNANYLLNVGPDATGRFPAEAEIRLSEMGEFVRRNAEALYGSQPVPFIMHSNRWGGMTVKENAIYLWLFNNFPGGLNFYGIRNKARCCRVLDSGAEIAFSQESRETVDYHKLHVAIPERLPTPVIVKVELEGTPDVNAGAYGAA